MNDSGQYLERDEEMSFDESAPRAALPVFLCSCRRTPLRPDFRKGSSEARLLDNHLVRRFP